MTAEKPSRLCTLDGFGDATKQIAGVDITELEPLSVLYIKTVKSAYRVIVQQPWKRYALLEGGGCFPSATKVSVSGASLGGSFLKVGWIGLGLCLELHCGDTRIITSPVREIRIASDHADIDPLAKVA